MKTPVLWTLGAVAFAIGLVATPAMTVAQPAPAPTPVPMSKPDFSSMMFLTGTWTCTQMLRGKQRPDTSTTTIGMDGMWMVTQDVAPPFDQYRTFPINSTSYTGYDPAIKQWIGVEVGSDGSYGIATSPGWQGSTITWTGKNLDGSSGTDVVTKVSDTETTDNSTGTDAQGKTTNVTISCKKTGN
ncbi:MAG TPA: hypothetical protein VMU38_11995 [Candidatus Binatia bacterium]|nr:hypothetical protein [Candidatus Binatia bacterium]